MQAIRKALAIAGGAALMALMLGAAAFAFSAAIEPAILTGPAAIICGFAAAADAKPAVVSPFVASVTAADTVRAPTAPSGESATPKHGSAVSIAPRRAKKAAVRSKAKTSTPRADEAQSASGSGSSGSGDTGATSGGTVPPVVTADETGDSDQAQDSDDAVSSQESDDGGGQNLESSDTEDDED